MKPRLWKIGVVAFVSFNAALALAAIPHPIAEKIVDGIMDWGDRHIGGPFKKGGGDEKITRAVVSAFVEPEKAYETFVDLTVKNGSETASPTQDTPGYSQWHDGVQMPQGAHQQAPVNQPQTPQPEVPQASQPPIMVNPEIHTTHDGDGPSPQNLRPDLERGLDNPSHDPSHIAATDSPSSAAPSASNTPADGHTKTILLEAGKTTNVPIPMKNGTIDINPNNINPNPEFGDRGNTAQSVPATGGGAPSSAPSAGNPSPVPTPQPAAPAAPSASPTPAPVPAPARADGHSSGFTSLGGLVEGRVDRPMPRDVGVTPVQHDHDHSGGGRAEPGGHAEPPGGHTGFDGHSREVEHASHIA